MPVRSAHHIPLTATFSGHAGRTGPLLAADINGQAAAELSKAGWPGPLPVRDGLLQLDLSRPVRLALLTRPKWETDPQGLARLNVGLVGLKW